MQILKFGHEDGEHIKTIWYHFPKLKIKAAAVFLMIVWLPLKKKKEREITWSELYIWTSTFSNSPQLQAGCTVPYQDRKKIIVGGLSFRSCDGFYWIYMIWRCNKWVEASLAAVTIWSRFTGPSLLRAHATYMHASLLLLPHPNV